MLVSSATIFFDLARPFNSFTTGCELNKAKNLVFGWMKLVHTFP